MNPRPKLALSRANFHLSTLCFQNQSAESQLWSVRRISSGVIPGWSKQHVFLLCCTCVSKPACRREEVCSWSPGFVNLPLSCAWWCLLALLSQAWAMAAVPLGDFHPRQSSWEQWQLHCISLGSSNRGIRNVSVWVRGQHLYRGSKWAFQVLFLNFSLKLDCLLCLQYSCSLGSLTVCPQKVIFCVPVYYLYENVHCIWF